jgi:hypothetical protein
VGTMPSNRSSRPTSRRQSRGTTGPVFSRLRHSEPDPLTSTEVERAGAPAVGQTPPQGYRHSTYKDACASTSCEVRVVWHVVRRFPFDNISPQFSPALSVETCPLAQVRCASR